MTDGCLYPNQQLASVGVEAYFAGRLATLLRLDEFQKRLLPTFSELLVPISRNDLAPALQPYQFAAPGGVEVVSVAVNQVGYSTTKYPGFGAFGPRAVTLIGDGLELFEIENLDRVFFHYENAIGLNKGSDDSIPVEQFLNLGAVPWRGKQPILQVDSRWHTKLDRGLQVVHLRTEDVPGMGAVVKLTIGSVVTPGGRSSKLSEYVTLAHDYAVQCFENLITDDFRKFISGKVDS